MFRSGLPGIVINRLTPFNGSLLLDSGLLRVPVGTAVLTGYNSSVSARKKVVINSSGLLTLKFSGESTKVLTRRSMGKVKELVKEL